MYFRFCPSSINNYANYQWHLLLKFLDVSIKPLNTYLYIEKKQLNRVKHFDPDQPAHLHPCTVRFSITNSVTNLIANNVEIPIRLYRFQSELFLTNLIANIAE
jgi:hypothetical protein